MGEICICFGSAEYAIVGHFMSPIHASLLCAVTFVPASGLTGINIKEPMPVGVFDHYQYVARWIRPSYTRSCVPCVRLWDKWCKLLVYQSIQVWHEADTFLT